MRISDWSSDVCSSDLRLDKEALHVCIAATRTVAGNEKPNASLSHAPLRRTARLRRGGEGPPVGLGSPQARPWQPAVRGPARSSRSEEHTSELQSLMRISYAVFCLKKKKNNKNKTERELNKSYDYS